MPLPSFIETPRFPENISEGATGGPTFSTQVFTAASGFEQRNMLWDEARAKYTVSHGIRDQADMDVLLAFFYNVRGKAIGFRFKDWSDYAINQEIATGNGSKLEFQIVKTYTVGASSYVRTIYKPVAATLAVSVGVNPMTEGADYTVNYATGVITFTSPPGTGQSITVVGEFDVPVRFDVDDMQIQVEHWQLSSWSGIQLIELKTRPA